MELTLARNWEVPAEEWLIPGFLCGTTNLLSGEPKLGKSMLAGHMVASLIHQTPFLGETPKFGFHKVAWMGFDAAWRSEYKSRFPFEIDFVFFADSASYRDNDEWESLGELLLEKNITLLVIDHLYGVASDLDLDESHEMRKALSPILQLQKKVNIPVLLITHAGKNGTGRAAHSMYLESQFRHLLRLTGNTQNSKRKLVSMGNLCETFNSSILLEPFKLELAMNPKENSDLNRRNRTEIALNQAHRLLFEAPDWARINFSKAGEWLAQEGISLNRNAGRTLANKLRKQGLITEPTDNQPRISPGLKYQLGSA